MAPPPTPLLRATPPSQRTSLPAPPPAPATSRPQTLLIFDLNGTLVDRTQHSDSKLRRQAAFKIGKTNVHVRAGTCSALRRLSASGRFAIAVWSSAMPENVEAMVKGTVPADVPLAFTLDRTHCVAAPKAGKEHATLKDLNRIWQNKQLNPQGLWNESNTVLIDDSPSKASLTPHNIMPVPTFELHPIDSAAASSSGDDCVLDELCGMLLEWKDGVSAQEWCSANYHRFPVCEEVELQSPAKAVKAAKSVSGSAVNADVESITQAMHAVSVKGMRSK